MISREKLILDELNHKKALKLIIQSNDGVSAGQIADKIGIRRSTMVYITKMFKERGIIKIAGRGESTKKGGKRPTIIEISDEVGVLFGIELLKKGFRYCITKINGQLISRGVELVNWSKHSPGKLAESLCFSVMNILEKQTLTAEDVVGIGIAVPGIVDRLEGKIIYSTLLGIEDYDLKHVLETEFDIPVYLVNDANAGALASKWFSELPDDIENIIYVNANQSSSEIGAGIIINKELYSGSNGFAGEILATSVSENKYFSSELDVFINQQLEIQDAESYEEVKNIINQTTHHVAGIIALLNPEYVFFGGNIFQTEENLEMITPVIKSRLDTQLRGKINYPALKVAPFRDYAPSMGATAMVLSTILE